MKQVPSVLNFAYQQYKSQQLGKMSLNINIRKPAIFIQSIILSFSFLLVSFLEQKPAIDHLNARLITSKLLRGCFKLAVDTLLSLHKNHTAIEVLHSNSSMTVPIIYYQTPVLVIIPDEPAFPHNRAKSCRLNLWAWHRPQRHLRKQEDLSDPR